MPDFGPVRQPTAADVHRAVGLLLRAQKKLDKLKAELAGLAGGVESALRILAPDRARSGGGVRTDAIMIRGKRVELTPVPAKVLQILAEGDGVSAGTRWLEVESIRRRLSARRKREVTQRSVVQAVYHIRSAFRNAGLPGTLILSQKGKWKLDLSDISLMELRRGPDSS